MSMKSETLSLKTIIYYNQIGNCFSKENCHYSVKHLKKKDQQLFPKH